MSIEQSGLPPAGWYPDPTGKPVQRWWDAQSWTAHERAIEAPPVAPALPQAVAAAPQPEVPSYPAQQVAAAHVPQALAPAPVAPLAQAPVHAPQHKLPVAAPQHQLEAAVPHVVQPAAPQPASSPQAPAFSTSPQYPLPAAPQPQAPTSAYAPQPIAQPIAQPAPAAVIAQPVAPQPQPTAPQPQPIAPRPQPVASTFAPEGAGGLMFPAPVSAVSVQSPTTAAFEFRFSSPDDLGVNGRAQAFRSTSPVAEPEAPVAEPEPEPPVAPAGRRSGRAPARGKATAAVETSASAESPSGWNTSSVWVLVLMPLLRAVFLAGAIYSLVELDVGYTSAGAIAVAPYLIALLVAVSDRKRLQAKGFDKPAHWAWALAGEWLYLIVRAVATRREGAGGGIVVLLWLLTLVVAAGGAYYYVSLTGLPLLTLLVG